ncbi:hypothetical protein ABIF96_005754 [Bradyrhizobium ottawaense]
MSQPFINQTIILGGIFIFCVGLLEILRAAGRVVRRMFR